MEVGTLDALISVAGECCPSLLAGKTSLLQETHLFNPGIEITGGIRFESLVALPPRQGLPIRGQFCQGGGGQPITDTALPQPDLDTQRPKAPFYPAIYISFSETPVTEQTLFHKIGCDLLNNGCRAFTPLQFMTQLLNTVLSARQQAQPRGIRLLVGLVC